MPATRPLPVLSAVDARQSATALAATMPLLADHLGPADVASVRHAAEWVAGAFAGGHPDFEPLDTPYHDLEHTLQVFHCLGGLLAGWHRSGDRPAPDARSTRLALIAALLHDAGYLKRRSEAPGPGARHTPVHVERGAEIAREYLGSLQVPAPDVAAVQSMIRCTAPDACPEAIPFESGLHRRLACAVATADLLGQMAADDYLRKLPRLFEEFAVAREANPEWKEGRLFPDLPTLLRQTPIFWQTYAQPRLNRTLDGVWRYLSDPWPDGPNEYLDRIERHLASLADRE